MEEGGSLLGDEMGYSVLFSVFFYFLFFYSENVFMNFDVIVNIKK